MQHTFPNHLSLLRNGCAYTQHRCRNKNRQSPNCILPSKATEHTSLPYHLNGTPKKITRSNERNSDLTGGFRTENYTFNIAAKTF